jgi:hypothetical protein
MRAALVSPYDCAAKELQYVLNHSAISEKGEFITSATPAVCTVKERVPCRSIYGNIFRADTEIGFIPRVVGPQESNGTNLRGMSTAEDTALNIEIRLSS